MKTSVNSTVERFVAFAGRFHFHAHTPLISRARPALPATRAHSTRERMRVAIARPGIERRAGHPSARCLPPSLASTTARLPAAEPDAAGKYEVR